MRALAVGASFLLAVATPLAAASSAYAEPFRGADQVKTVAENEAKAARIPSLSMGMVRAGQSTHFSVGDPVPDQAGYQLGSVSKAFTGLAVLLLEGRGRLSLDEPASRYLPWFEVSYNGAKLPSGELKVSHLLYQTSGFTNDEGRYPPAAAEESLTDAMRRLAQVGLAARPGAEFAYANTNYNLLGAIIEQVSGMSYADFMRKEVLEPLGLDHTFAEPAAGRADWVVPGARLSFFGTHRYDLPIAAGSVPAGYLVSTVEDMTRWLGIQLGTIDVPPEFARAVQKSHLADPRRPAGAEAYAAGWLVGNDGTLQHSGVTPNYSSQVVIDRNANRGVVVLTNLNSSANTGNIAENAMNVLEGRHLRRVPTDIWTWVDTIFSSVAILAIALTVAALAGPVWVTRQASAGKRRLERDPRRTAVYLIPAAAVLILDLVTALILPVVFQSDWGGLLKWAPLSVPIAVVALALLAVALARYAIVASLRPRVRGTGTR